VRNHDLGFAPSRRILAPGAIAVACGLTAPFSPAAAVAVGVLAGFGLVAATAPGVVVALVLPASLLTYRVGPLSIADLVLVGAVAVAIGAGLVPLEDKRLRAALAVASVGLGFFAIVTLASPTSTAVLEFGHRAALLIGSLLLGAAAARLDVVGLAIKLLAVTGAVYATAAIVQALVLAGSPAYPLGVTKNHAGGILAVTVLILLVEPTLGRGVWLGLVTPLLIAGLIATQSRAAILALLIGLAYACLRDRGLARRLLLPAITGAVLSVASLLSLEREREVSEDIALSSTGERLRFWEQAVQDWIREPVYGNGLRYYLDPAYGYPMPVTDEFPAGAPPHPHNLGLEALAESGLVGTVGLLVILLGTLTVAARCMGKFGLAAQVVVVGTFVIGAFDLFWLAGRTVVPFFMVGAACVYASRVRAPVPEPIAAGARR
jgi:O-antigen ligase